MLLEYLNLKKTPYNLEKIESNECIILPNAKFEINKSLITLSISDNKIVLFSFLLSSIFRLFLDDYNKYIKNFSPKVTVPQILLDYNIIVPKTNLPRIPRINYIPNLQLILTSTCNLRCLYCYARSGRRKDNRIMSFEIAKAAIDCIAKYNIKGLNLKFIGAGENTTQFLLIKKIFYYAKKKFPNVNINPISTNGVISKKIADWLIKNAQRVQISCDGPAFIQDKYRPLVNGTGSSKFVEKTIKYFLKKGKNFRVRVTMVDDFYGNELNIINYFWQLGVKDVAFGPLDIIGAAKNKSFETKKSVKFQNLLLLYNEFKKLAELQNELKMQMNILHFHQLGSTITCAIYTRSSFVVDAYGNVSACDRYTGPLDLREYPFMNDLLIGSYDDKSKKIKIHVQKLKHLVKIIDNQLKLNQCESCFLLPACSTICLYALGQQYGTIDPKKRTCYEREQIFIPAVFDYLAQHYFINKKPCLEYKNNKLIYSLLYTDFELTFSKNGKNLINNPYLIITNISILPKLAKKIIKYKNSRQELTAFLIKFELKENNLSLRTGKRIENFLKILKNNHVYYKITEPLPKQIWGIRQQVLSQELGVPRTYKDCLELYRIFNNKVYFSEDKIGSKKFNEYEDRDEIYQDFLSQSNLKSLAD